MSIETTDPPKPGETLTGPDICAALGISESALLKRCAKAEFPQARKYRGARYWLRNEVEAFLAAQRLAAVKSK